MQGGDVFGIMSLFGGENKNDSAIAMEDCLICVIDAPTLKKMMDTNPRLNNYIFKIAGLQIQKLERKLHSLVYKNAETRVKEFVTEYINEFGEESKGVLVAKNLLSNKDIGKLTSTSRQTVNKILNELKSEGYIHFDKNIIQINKKKQA